MDIFQKAINDISGRYIKRCSECPTQDELYQAMLEDSCDGELADHINNCSYCSFQMKCLEDSEWLWMQSIEHHPDKALESMLGEEGCQRIRMLMRESKSPSTILSSVKDETISFITSLWQPLLAGEAVTAADLVSQSHRFEMDFGEYVLLNCNWWEEGSVFSMELAWEANIFQKSRLRARFMNPENNAVLADIPLGTDLCGKKYLTERELPFHPAIDKWGVVIVAEVL